MYIPAQQAETKHDQGKGEHGFGALDPKQRRVGGGGLLLIAEACKGAVGLGEIAARRPDIQRAQRVAGGCKLLLGSQSVLGQCLVFLHNGLLRRLAEAFH